VTVAAITGEKARADVASWLAWISQHRPNIDALRRIAMLSDPEPTPEDLKPYLHRWSSNSPDSHA